MNDNDSRQTLAALRKENEALRQKLADAERVREENRVLRQQLREFAERIGSNAGDALGGHSESLGSETTYRTLFEAAGDAIFLMEGEIFIDCNTQALILFGCGRADVLGSTPWRFSPDIQSDGRPSREKAREMIERALRTGYHCFEWTHSRLDGSIVETEVTLSRLELRGRLHLLAIVRDVTARRKMEAEIAYRRAYLEELVEERTRRLAEELQRREAVEQALRESETLLRSVLDNLDSAIYVADMQTYEVVLANRYVQERFGPVEGRICWQVFQRDQKGPCPFCTNSHLLDEKGQPTGVLVWQFRNTITNQWFICRDAAIKWPDGRFLRLEIATDVTTLMDALERAESADRLKSQFLAMMSHELRTPLNSILGFSGILLEGLAGPLNEEQTRQLRMVQKSAEHLLDLITDILDISKIDAGELRLVKERFHLPELIERAVATVRPQAVERGLILDVVIAPEVGAIVSDRRRVEQILLNLLSNAIKFTDTGGVRVEAKVAAGRVCVSVADTGVGIQQHEMQRLFKPFSQTSSATTRGTQGTGLGLAIARRLVEALGGSIRAESEQGKGSTFSFDLPLEGSEDEGTNSVR